MACGAVSWMSCRPEKPRVSRSTRNAVRPLPRGWPSVRGEDDVDVGFGSARDERLQPVEHEGVTVAPGRGLDPSDVGARTRLCDGEREQAPAGHEIGQVPCALLPAALPDDGHRTESLAPEGEVHERAVVPEMLPDDAQHRRVPVLSPRAPVLGTDVQSEETMHRHGIDQLAAHDVLLAESLRDRYELVTGDSVDLHRQRRLCAAVPQLAHGVESSGRTFAYDSSVVPNVLRESDIPRTTSSMPRSRTPRRYSS